MTERLSKEDLLTRVNSYLKRTGVKKYPLNEKGTYQIIGGCIGSLGDRATGKNNIVKGTFLEALAYALTQENFYADWCDNDALNNTNHGYVEKIQPLDLKTKFMLRDQLARIKPELKAKYK